MHAKNAIRIVLGTALILLIPLIAMQFTDEVQWTPSDFVVVAALLLGFGFAYELLRMRVRPKYRIVFGIGVLGALLLVWAQLAVGLL